MTWTTELQEEWLADIPHVLAVHGTYDLAFSLDSPAATYLRTLALTDDEAEAVELKQQKIAANIMAGLPT